LQPAVPLLKQAAQAVAMADAPQPIVIANYGAAEGRNALAPMAIAIAALSVAHLDVFLGEDRIWANVERDRNAAAFGRR
jgi:pyrrolidone-carboxylate peptidase